MIPYGLNINQYNLLYSKLKHNKKLEEGLISLGLVGLTWGNPCCREMSNDCTTIILDNCSALQVPDWKQKNKEFFVLLKYYMGLSGKDIAIGTLVVDINDDARVQCLQEICKDFDIQIIETKAPRYTDDENKENPGGPSDNMVKYTLIYKVTPMRWGYLYNNPISKEILQQFEKELENVK